MSGEKIPPASFIYGSLYTTVGNEKDTPEYSYRTEGNKPVLSNDAGSMEYTGKISSNMLYITDKTGLSKAYGALK